MRWVKMMKTANEIIIDFILNLTRAEAKAIFHEFRHKLSFDDTENLAQTCMFFTYDERVAKQEITQSIIDTFTRVYDARSIFKLNQNMPSVDSFNKTEQAISFYVRVISKNFRNKVYTNDEIKKFKLELDERCEQERRAAELEMFELLAV